jgi:hypothetical protein
MFGVLNNSINNNVLTVNNNIGNMPTISVAVHRTIVDLPRKRIRWKTDS